MFAASRVWSRVKGLRSLAASVQRVTHCVLEGVGREPCGDEARDVGHVGQQVGAMLICYLAHHGVVVVPRVRARTCTQASSAGYVHVSTAFLRCVQRRTSICVASSSSGQWRSDYAQRCIVACVRGAHDGRSVVPATISLGLKSFAVCCITS